MIAKGKRETTWLAVFALALSIAACSPPDPPPVPPSGTPPASPPAASTPSPAAPQPATAEIPSAQPAVASTTAAQARPGAPDPSARATSSPSTAPSASSPQADSSFREITIPAGTALNVSLTTAVASDTSNVEDQVRGTLTRALVVGGVTVVPANSEIIGSVLEARRSGRVKGRASIAFRFEQLRLRDTTLPIRTALITRQAAANRRDDVKKGAIGGAAGAVVGGILGGGDGAAIGAGVGAAGAVLATRGDEVRLGSGATVRTTLQQPLKVVVPR